MSVVVDVFVFVVFVVDVVVVDVVVVVAPTASNFAHSCWESPTLQGHLRSTVSAPCATVPTASREAGSKGQMTSSSQYLPEVVRCFVLLEC